MMSLVETLQVIRELRSEEVVIATMGAEREWLKMSQHVRDFCYVPSAMGQAPTLGLGLALARPDLRVWVLNGDGCMLMNLGCLVTIAALAVPNYCLLVFENGVYEVTGSQPTASGADFAGLARAAGFRRYYHFDDRNDWRHGAADVLGASGPCFVTLRVEPVRGGEVSPKAPCPMQEQLERFRRGIRL